MALSAQLRHVLSVAGLDVDKVISYSQGQALLISESIADSTTDGLVACTVDISQLKACIIVAEGGAMTLETNNGAVPDDTISLLDGVPFVWSNDYLAAHFSADITGLYMTNSSGSASVLTAVFIVDPTI
jgi:hypothetical protein